MPLTDLFCRSVKAESRIRKYSDGGGLHLAVQPNGSKLWRMNYRFGGRQKTLSFGAYPATKLSDARGMRDAAKAALAKGADPARKDLDDDPGTIAGETFEAVTREWLASQEPGWTRAHALRIGARLRADVLPVIGSIPIRDVTAPQILVALRAIEARQALDVAKRARQSVSSIFRYAIATGRADRDPAVDLKGALKTPPRAKHMAALQAGELSEFFGKLGHYDGEKQTALAIELTMRTLTRTNEVRFGKWAEIDYGENLWRIPAERMKAHREHLIPLTPQVLDVLGRLKLIAGDKSEWILPGVKGQPISNNTMLFALYRMGYRGRATIHGMRSLASTLLNESGLWTVDAIELQLAHVEGNSVRAAYNHATLLPERRKMLEWYCDQLDGYQSEIDSDEVKPDNSNLKLNDDLLRLLG